MADESVAIEANEIGHAITEWCDDLMWDRLRGRLPEGVRNRLKKVHRCMYSTNMIQRMLFADRLGKNDQQDSGVAFEGLAPCEVEALYIAALELNGKAETLIDEIARGGLRVSAAIVAFPADRIVRDYDEQHKLCRIVRNLRQTKKHKHAHGGEIWPAALAKLERETRAREEAMGWRDQQSNPAPARGIESLAALAAACARKHLIAGIESGEFDEVESILEANPELRRHLGRICAYRATGEPT